MSIIDEIERRHRQERGRYFRPTRPEDPNPFGMPSNDQYGALHSTADEVWVFGGARSSKTELMTNSFDMFCRGVHPVRSAHQAPPVKCRLCAPSWREGVEGVLLSKFQEITIRKALRGGSWRNAWSSESHKLHYANGSFIQFKAATEGRDPDGRASFDGIDLDACGHDEPGPRWMYEKNKARLADRNGWFMATMTPEKGITWERDHVQNPPEGVTVDHWFFDQRGNPHLSEEGVRKYLASIRDEDLFKMKIMGQFVSYTGLVIPQFDRSKHIVPDRELHPDAVRIFMIDTHTKVPCAAVWMAWEPPTERFPFPKLVIYRTVKRFLRIPDWQKLIVRLSQGERIVHWLGDEPGGGEGKDIHGKEGILREFNRGDYRLPIEQVPKPAGSFDADIMRLRTMFTPDPISRESQLEIFASCDYEPEMIRGKWHGSIRWELEKYQFRRESVADEQSLREKVADVDDHFISCLRYGSRYAPSFTGGKIKSGLDGSWS